MAQVLLPAGALITSMYIEPFQPGQIVLESLFTGSVQVLNRGYASWRGAAEFAIQDHQGESLAQEMESFFSSLGGQANWVSLPINRPTVAAGINATISAVVTNTDGTLAHNMSAALTGLRIGHWLSVQDSDRVFMVRAFSGVSVTLDPQIPLTVGTEITRAVNVRARSQTGSQSLYRTLDFWGPWRFDWQEGI